MVKWVKKQWLLTKCEWIRFKHRKELFELVFNGDSYPDVGETLTDANGVKLLIVDKGHREGNSWVLGAYVIYSPPIPEELQPIDFDFISEDFPVGHPVVMDGIMWIKQGPGSFNIHYMTEALKA